jgi:hypothetical protein
MSVYTDLQSKCLKLGGAYVYYSQSEEPTNTLINMLPYTEDGICQALSAKWIAEHANDGSLWNWLMVPGTKNIKQSAIANLMINFTESVVSGASSLDHNLGNRRARKKIANRLANPTTKKANTGNLGYQDFVTTKYLGLYGMRRRTLPAAALCGPAMKSFKFGLGPKVGQMLGLALSPTNLNTKGADGSYVLISIMGDGGHALAAFVGRDDVAFFDPNFGEFWFPKRADFRTFLDYFWQRTGYSQDYESFYLLGYAKGVN